MSLLVVHFINTWCSDKLVSNTFNFKFNIINFVSENRISFFKILDHICESACVSGWLLKLLLSTWYSTDYSFYEQRWSISKFIYLLSRYTFVIYALVNIYLLRSINTYAFKKFLKEMEECENRILKTFLTSKNNILMFFPWKQNYIIVYTLLVKKINLIHMWDNNW